MIGVASVTVDLARAQFATTSIYHFLFVPLTLGLAVLVATMQTIWHRGHDDAWLRLTRFFGTLLLINFAIGVATGLVQEFQFGMSWAVYSNFVGGVFGAPLAIEGLLAFFLEATFLGLWIFGWGRLPPRVHLATIWIAALGTWLSAYFILVANSWMQHPVGYKLVDGKAQLTSVASRSFLLISSCFLSLGRLERVRGAREVSARVGHARSEDQAVEVIGHWNFIVMPDRTPILARRMAVCVRCRLDRGDRRRPQ
jgi:cytochrome bd-type quinol oxidase subunit 1